MSTTPPPHQCPEFKRYMEEFRKRLRTALDQNKWYLSERQGHDVGEAAATQDFLQKHFDRFAEELRARFCGHDCSRHDQCPLARFVRALPASAKAMALHQEKTKTQPIRDPSPA